MIDDQDHGVDFAEPELEVPPTDGPGDRLSAFEERQPVRCLDLEIGPPTLDLTAPSVGDHGQVVPVIVRDPLRSMAGEEDMAL